MNKQWFLDHLTRLNMSQRRFASILNIDPSSLSKVLTGQRKLQSIEAIKTAEMFGCSIDELYQEFGLTKRFEQTSHQINFFYDESGEMTPSDEEAYIDNLPTELLIIQCRNNLLFDGWNLFFEPKPMPVESGVFGFLIGDNKKFIGVAKRGYSKNEYRLTTLDQQFIKSISLLSMHRLLRAVPPLSS